MVGTQVPSDRIRMLLRLVGEAHELRGSSEARFHALAGLARIVGAPIGIACTLDSLGPSAPIEMHDYLEFGWSGDDSRGVFAYYRETPAGRDPMVRAILRGPEQQPLMTYRRADLIGDGAWYGSVVHNDVHRPARIDDMMISLRFEAGPRSDGEGLIFKRAAGERAFSPEERDIVHLFHAECGWVFRRPRDATSRLSAGLTRREQEILRLLLTDASEKLVAAQLGISRHTAHDHVKMLYRKLGVSSRAALMVLALGDDARRAAPDSRAPGRERLTG